MEENYNSKIRTTEIREMVLLNLREFFESRQDFRFISKENKENKILIINEYSEHKDESFYPRIVLHRNGSQYSQLGGANDVHEHGDTFDSVYSRSDLNTHNFSLVVKGEGGTITEQLAYLTSFFVRFFSKELVFKKGFKPFHNVKHLGLSSISKTDGDANNNSSFQAVISFLVADNEIAKIRETEKGKLFLGFEEEFIMEKANCCNIG